MRDAAINLRARPVQRDLIDHAAQLLGKNRSDFMLEAACENKYLAVAGCASSGKCLAPHVPVGWFSCETSGSTQYCEYVILGCDWWDILWWRDETPAVFPQARI